MATQKKPLIALLLSLIVPGLGQIYNSQLTKGLVIAAICFALGLSSFLLSGLTSLSVALTLILLWVSAILDAYKTAKASGQPSDWYYKAPYVIAMLFLVGPLALPLLWRSPYFSRLARWGWTALVIGAVLFFFAMPYLLNRIIQQIPDLAVPLRKFSIPRWSPFLTYFKYGSENCERVNRNASKEPATPSLENFLPRLPPCRRQR